MLLQTAIGITTAVIVALSYNAGYVTAKALVCALKRRAPFLVIAALVRDILVLYLGSAVAVIIALHAFFII